MNKQVLRDLFLEKRKTLTQSELRRRSHLLCQNAIEFIQQHNETHYHIFLPIERQKEPDVWPVFHWLIDSPDHAVYLSKTHFQQKKLTHYHIQDAGDMSVGNFGIPEPQKGQLIEPKILEVVFVPLVSFDHSGNRIGYGAGLYDRFLSETAPECIKVGLAITPPLDNIDYAEAFDIKLDLCITHLGIDYIKKGA